MRDLLTKATSERRKKRMQCRTRGGAGGKSRVFHVFPLFLVSFVHVDVIESEQRRGAAARVEKETREGHSKKDEEEHVNLKPQPHLRAKMKMNRRRKNNMQPQMGGGGRGCSVQFPSAFSASLVTWTFFLLWLVRTVGVLKRVRWLLCAALPSCHLLSTVRLSCFARPASCHMVRRPLASACGVTQL